MAERDMPNLDDKFPANSHKSKDGKKTDKKVEKIVSGVVTRKKKGILHKMAETFLGEDIDDVKRYIIYDVVVPAAKNTITDVVSSGIEMLMFGETRGRNTRRDKGYSKVSYSNYYKSDKKDDRRYSVNRRASHSFDNIVLETRVEAEEVLSSLVDLCVDYGFATVADLYDLVGITGDFTDNNYGWSDLDNARVERVRSGGYSLNLPRTRKID